MGSLSYVKADKVETTKDLYQLASLKVILVDVGDGGVIIQNTVESSFVTEVKERLYEHPELMTLRESIPQ